MSRVYSVHINPYKGLADSVITSNPFHLMDAFDWSYSWYTTSGATSRTTLELSNSGADDSADIPEASWSRWTVFGHTKPPGSGASTEFPPLGVRWGRFRRWPSSATTARGLVIDVNKQVR
jgi:hypothetical protein